MYMTDKNHLEQYPNKNGDNRESRILCCEIPEDSQKVSGNDEILSVVEIVRMVAGDSYWLSRIL